MAYSIRITDRDFGQLKALLWEADGVESAALLLAGLSKNGDQHSLLVRRVVAIPSAEYRVRTRHRIELTTRAINGLAALAEANGLLPMVAHSHPDPIGYSASDDQGEARLAQSLWPFAPEPIFGSLLLTPEKILGRVWAEEQRNPIGVDEIRVIGRAVRRYWLDGREPSDQSDHLTHGRQILAFGVRGQRELAALRIGIVGAGGTGSPLAEQLIRLGVDDLLMIDRGHFEPSNVSRVFGSTASHARPHRFPWWPARRRSKVAIVAEHLRRINPDANITAVEGNVVIREVARTLLGRDVVFACTDDHWGRSVINQIAYQYLIPTVNVGIAIASQDGQISAGVGSVQILRPGHGCLWCSGYLNADRIRAESLPGREKEALLREGYLIDVDDPAPSIVTITTLASSLAGTWLVQLATDFMGVRGDISRLNYDLTEGTVRRGQIPQQSECVCQQVKAFGDLRPLPI